MRSPAFVRFAFREEEITRLRLAFLYTGSPVPVSSARRWRFSRVPRLPLCVHAPLADPGGVLSTRHDVSRTVPSESSRSSAFPSSCRVILSDHNYTIFRGSVTRPIHSLHLASYTPLQDMHAGSLQIRWLTFSGENWTVSYPYSLGNIIQFHELLSDPMDLDLTRHEEPLVRRRARHSASSRSSV